MDGILVRRTTGRPLRFWTICIVLIATVYSVAPARAQEITSFGHNRTLRRLQVPSGEVNRRMPVTIRPPARLVDARQSPMVAVVAGINSSESANLAVGLPEPNRKVDSQRSPATEELAANASASDRNPTVEEALAMRGSVTFRKTPISEVVFMLSDLWKINIVAGADVSGDVSGAFQDAPLSEVLSAALTASGYGYRQMGSSLVVLPIDQIGSAATATAGLGSFSQSGIAYFSPQFTEAEQMAEPLQTALGEAVVVAVYPEENRIMVKGTAEDLRIASEAIRQLDVPRPQVRITAMIYDVSLGELEKIGVNWNRQVREIANGSDEALSEVTRSVSDFFAATSDLTTTGATSLGIRTINNSRDASVFLEALDSTSEAKLLADPSITVGDRTQASIRIVQQIPIVGANPVEGSNAVFTQTEFKEAGVILNVLPRISRDGTIQLQVQPEYSVVSEITAAGPVIDTRTADTIVRVNDGQMFVLGGLRQKSVIESVRGVPYLRDIKFLGKLFRGHSTEIRESELIVFLRPELITPYYAGHPREQMAACVASDQLDRIPHAQSTSIIPCCKDPLCPNHHPRPRANLGSYSVGMMGGYGMQTHTIVTDQPVDVSSEINPPIVTPVPAPAASDLPMPVEAVDSPAIIEVPESIPPAADDQDLIRTGDPPTGLEMTTVEDVYPARVHRIAPGGSR